MTPPSSQDMKSLFQSVVLKRWSLPAKSNQSSKDGHEWQERINEGKVSQTGVTSCQETLSETLMCTGDDRGEGW